MVPPWVELRSARYRDGGLYTKIATLLGHAPPRLHTPPAFYLLAHSCSKDERRTECSKMCDIHIQTWRTSPQLIAQQPPLSHSALLVPSCAAKYVPHHKTPSGGEGYDVAVFLDKHNHQVVAPCAVLCRQVRAAPQDASRSSWTSTTTKSSSASLALIDWRVLTPSIELSRWREN